MNSNDTHVTPPANVEKTPEIRIFISSTFRDMQDEREYLIKHIFPELRSICRERGVEFTEIDLRWGVTEEEAQQGKVLKICLDEIDKCRPYFIGILGERYGWIPDKNDIKKNTELLTQYPWVKDSAESEISVTEMEIIYGVLANPTMAEHAFFYFRDQANTKDQFRETDSSLQEKLRSLKDRIRESSFPVHENFPSREKLGELVRQDLLSVIETNFPLEEAPTPLEQERRAQEAYAHTRRRAYIARPSYMEALDKHVESIEPPLIIIGESGSGKSSLISYWVNEYRKKNPGAFIIMHFVGASSSSGYLGIIQRVLEEIKIRYGLPDDIPTTPEGLEKEFSNWLAKIQKEKLILVLDSLDRLPGETKFLRWLPRYFPPNVRAFFTVPHGETLAALEKNGFSTFEIHLLSESERDDLIINYLGKYRKALSPDQRLAIITEEKTANPLFLLTLLEELRIFGSFEELNDRIEHYVSSIDLPDLFQRVLIRMEGDYGHENMEKLLGMLWASRHGLSETEVIGVSGVNRLDLSVLLQAFDFKLSRNEGLLNFYHQHLRQAVESRYYEKKGDQALIAESFRAAHLAIADYFDQLEVSLRKAEELPWQLHQAGELERLKQCLSSIPMFLEFSSDDKHYELLGYWREIGDLTVMEQTYFQNATEFFQNFPDPIEEANAYDRLGQFFHNSGRYAAAQPFLQKALDLNQLSFGPESAATADSAFLLARLLHFLGEYQKAEPIYERSLELRMRILGKQDPVTARTIFHLARLEQEQGKFEEAEPHYRDALDIIRSTRGDYHEETAKILNNLALLRRERGDFTEAERLYRESIEVWERVAGKNHPNRAVSIYNLAQLVHMKGDKNNAEKLYREALGIWEKVFGSEHPTTAMGGNSLAILLRDAGKFEQAEKMYRDILAIWVKLLGENHLNTATTYNNLAEVLLDQNKFEESAKYYSRSRETFEKTLGEGHPYTSHPIHGLGMLYMKSGDHKKASEFLRHAYEIREKAYGVHPDTLEALGDYISSLEKMDSSDALADAQKRKQEIEADLAKGS
jgi:tetratricopeptide (TPR) repeat protein